VRIAASDHARIRHAAAHVCTVVGLRQTAAGELSDALGRVLGLELLPVAGGVWLVGIRALRPATGVGSATVSALRDFSRDHGTDLIVGPVEADAESFWSRWPWQDAGVDRTGRRYLKLSAVS
jgi:hypothetical protein